MRLVQGLMLVLVAAAFAVGLPGSSLLRADDPTITQLSPPGGQRGTEAEIVISGARLGDARELLLYQPGMQVTELTADGNNKVKVKLQVAQDCPPGLHALRLATESGISNLRYFGVSPLPQVDEVEPNGEFDSPQVLPLNTTLNGVIQTEDVDYFALDLNAGQTVTVELEGLRLGTEFFDPTVAFFDQDRFELSRSDDAPLLQQDCVCSLTAPTAGRYIIEVRESSFGGNDRCQYRMHVGDFPRPISIVPAGGRPGETIHATLVDASGATWTQEIQVPSDATAIANGEFEFLAERDGKVAPSPNRLRVIDLPNVMEREPDDKPDDLAAIEGPVALNGTLQAPGDVDWFKIKGKKNQQVEFTVFGRRVLRSPLDSWLEISKVGGGRLASNDDSGGPDSVQAVKFPEDGEYLISIRDQLNEGGPDYAYRIEVAPAKAKVSLNIDELTRYFSQTVAVPRGAQMAVLLRAKRTGFNGDLGLRLENLPDGLELMTPTIAANQTYIPMLIRAAQEAPLDAALVPLIAESLAVDNPIVGTLEQRTMLVRGQNNRDMWGHDSSHLAVAVTQELPFSISVVQPEVPIVRNGLTHYIVNATRQEGYKERIYLRSLYNPPGCSASGSVRIEPDQTQALIPVTANKSAGIGTYPITILARAKASDGTVWAASEFINFEVADSFFAYKFGKTVVETGKSAAVVVGLEVKRDPQGDVEFELVGLPAGVTCSAPKISNSAAAPDGELQQLTFPIDVAADARLGQFKTLVIRATIRRPEGEIVQNEGNGEVQLVAPAAGGLAGNNQPAAPAANKPLSRLEQLRQAKQLLENRN